MSRNNDDPHLHALKDVQKDLQSIRSAGGQFVWLGFLGAIFIFTGIAAAAWAAIGQDAFLALDPVWYLAGGLIGAGPALASIMAGFMARQSLQTARANTLVLRASQLLLMPSDTASKKIDTLGQAIRNEAARIDELVESSNAALSELGERLYSERKEVSKSIETNETSIRQLMEKLADERQALAELTSAVDAQAAAMSDAIPRQARLMADAARSAQQEVAKNDDALQTRLESLDEAARRLSEGLSDLTEMTQHSEINANRLANAIAGFEDRLKESAKLVDSAIRASELASAAASETGDSLNAAVASALDGAREASDFIRMQSREAASESMKAMADLRQAGEAAQAAVKAAGIAARSQADDTEKRIDTLSQSMFEAASRATSAAEAGLERTRLRIERANAFLNGGLDDNFSMPPVEDPRDSFTIPPPVTSEEKPDWLRPRQDEPSEDAATPSEPEEIVPEETNEQSAESLAPDEEQTQTQLVSKASEVASGVQDFTDKESGLSWKDLLAGLDTPAEERDEAARYILSEIEQSGIELTDLFKPRMVKKISNAARRGERNRRRAVREHAGGNVQSLIYRLQDDISFRNSSDRFLTVEEPDALRALSETEKSRASASPRLAAYLLLDSAMSSV